MFAFAIMAAPVDDLRAWVSDQLAPYGYALDDGGEVIERLAEHRELRLGLLREGRGVIARLDDDRALAAVARRRFDLGWQLGKDGFEDGDCLLTRDDCTPYAADVVDRVDAAIRAAGFDVETSWSPTCHNPLRVQDEQLVRDGPLLPRAWRDGVRVDPGALRGVEVEIWAYDFAALDDDLDDFWR